MTKLGAKNSLETGNESVDAENLSSIEIYRKLLDLNYVTPADEDSQFIEPSAYEYVPNITLPHSTIIEAD